MLIWWGSEHGEHTVVCGMNYGLMVQVVMQRKVIVLKWLLKWGLFMAMVFFSPANAKCPTTLHKHLVYTPKCSSVHKNMNSCWIYTPKCSWVHKNMNSCWIHDYSILCPYMNGSTLEHNTSWAIVLKCYSGWKRYWGCAAE